MQIEAIVQVEKAIENKPSTANHGAEDRGWGPEQGVEVEVMLSAANHGAAAPAGFRQGPRAARQADRIRETSTSIKED